MGEKTKLTKRLEGEKTSIGRKDKTHKEVRGGKGRALGEKTKLTKRLEGEKTSIGRKDKTPNVNKLMYHPHSTRSINTTVSLQSKLP